MLKKNSAKDLTVGSPTGHVVSFMLPTLFGLIFQQLYSMVDTMIVGKYLGIDALAGVGSTGSVNFLVLGFCMGVCTGFAIPVAQEFGRKNEEGLRRFVGNIVWMTIGFASVITVVTCLLCRNILLWMNTPTDVFEYAYSYIFIIFLGIPVTFLYNILSGIIRSLGDSKSPLIFLLISSALNIALDFYMIITLDMGVAGAAWATVISELISGLLCFVFIIFRFPILRLSKDDIKPRISYILRLCHMGIPMGLQYSITAIGNILLQTAVNGLGSNCVAAMTAANKVNHLVYCMYEAIGTTMSTFAGQNVGAGKLDRLGKGLRSALIIGCSYSVVMLGVLYLFGNSFTMLFLSGDDLARQTEILALSQQLLLINAAFYIPLAFVYIVRFTLQGMGFATLAVFAGVFEMIARAIVALSLVPVFGYTAACFASPAAWVFADIFLIIAFAAAMKKLRNCLEQNKSCE